jgi:alcohol dehydrogenase (quinone), cytochrome c subunit
MIMKSVVAAVSALALMSAAALAQAQGQVQAQSQGQPQVRAAQGPSRGEYLARAGDCVACHSVVGGAAFAGGLAMGSPLGTLYTTNITPDRDSGIGRYSLQDFDRAVRLGIAPDGRQLYPAMPYTSYAKMSAEDVRELYHFFMNEVPPAQTPNKPHDIPALLSPRWPLALWNMLFADEAHFVPRKEQSAEWNRGAYLVEGLGHCGACHTPRGVALQEKGLDHTSSSYLGGAELDGWWAPSLRGEQRTGLGAWSQDDIVAFLKTGHNKFGAAFGSMIDVINNSTPYMNDADLKAIAVYLKSLSPQHDEPAYVYDQRTTDNLKAGHMPERGASIYAANCSSCHGLDGKGMGAFMPALAGNPTTMDEQPTSLINLVLNGAAPLVVAGVPAPYRMPQYRVQLDDQEIADVLTFVRAAWGNHASAVNASDVAALRHATDPASDQVVLLKMR